MRHCTCPPSAPPLPPAPRAAGKAQLISNINACVAVVDTIRTTLVSDGRRCRPPRPSRGHAEEAPSVDPPLAIRGGRLRGPTFGREFVKRDAGAGAALCLTFQPPPPSPPSPRPRQGPRGMDKLVHDSRGMTTISNDGATIMKVRLPACLPACGGGGPVDFPAPPFPRAAVAPAASTTGPAA